MRKFRLLFLFFALSASACAGGSSRYGCPAKSGHSCKSVSEVYAETTSGTEDASGPLRKPRGSKKSARAQKKLPKGMGFRAGKDTRGDEDASRAEGAIPVYIPPRVIRLWIAPCRTPGACFILKNTSTCSRAKEDGRSGENRPARRARGRVSGEHPPSGNRGNSLMGVAKERLRELAARDSLSCYLPTWPGRRECTCLPTCPWVLYGR